MNKTSLDRFLKKFGGSSSNWKASFTFYCPAALFQFSFCGKTLLVKSVSLTGGTLQLFAQVRVPTIAIYCMSTSHGYISPWVGHPGPRPELMKSTWLSTLASASIRLGKCNLGMSRTQLSLVWTNLESFESVFAPEIDSKFHLSQISVVRFWMQSQGPVLTFSNPWTGITLSSLLGSPVFGSGQPGEGQLGRGSLRVEFAPLKRFIWTVLYTLLLEVPGEDLCSLLGFSETVLELLSCLLFTSSLSVPHDLIVAQPNPLLPGPGRSSCAKMAMGLLKSWQPPCQIAWSNAEDRIWQGIPPTVPPCFAPPLTRSAPFLPASPNPSRPFLWPCSCHRLICTFFFPDKKIFSASENTMICLQWLMDYLWHLDVLDAGKGCFSFWISSRIELFPI